MTKEFHHQKPANRGRPVLILVGLWVLLNNLPLVIFSDTLGLASWYLRASSLTFADLELAQVVVQLSIVATGAAAVSLCCIARRLSAESRRPIFAKLALFLLVTIPLATLIGFVATSWIWLRVKGTFLTPSDASLLAYTTDLQALSWHLRAPDILAFVGLLSFPALLASLIWLMAPSSWSGARVGAIVFSIAATGLVVSSALAPHASERQREDFRFYLGLLTAPHGSLVQELFFGSLDFDSQQVELHLKKVRPLTDYIAENKARLKRRPNILLVVVEALRHDVISQSAHGREVMPAVQELSRRGMSFDVAYSNAPDTGYSLSALTTALHPLKFPVRDMNLDLAYPSTRAHDLFSALGYRTAYLATAEWIAQERVSRSPLLDLKPEDVFATTRNNSSLSQEMPQTGAKTLLSQDEEYTSALEKWIATPSEERPFFAFLYLGSSHFPYDLPASAEHPFTPYQLDEPVAFYGYSPRLDEVLRNRYWNTLHNIDRMIARLARAAEKRDGDNSTIVIVTGDHGELFHEHGEVTHAGRLHEGAIKVPIVISNMNGRSALSKTTPISHLDVVPTIIDLIGLPPFDGFQGSSGLAPVDELVSPVAGVKPILMTAHTGIFEDALLVYPFKYVRNYRGEAPRMFRIDIDPGEQLNLVEREPELAAEMAALLARARATQLSYYSKPADERLKFYPPTLPEYVVLRHADKAMARNQQAP